VGNLIAERVRLARAGENPFVIARLRSGWVVIGDVQPLPGYCLLLADPVVESLNALDEAARAAYLLDVARIGDALLQATGACCINYETWGNAEPALHTHITPRYLTEPEDKRRRPACMGYDWTTARPFDPLADRPFIDRMRALLASG
jgi:diadenosine tetraphosphate (Ap4A) HIT family hydrolase